MSVNNFLPHVLVIPEDDANSQLADGFYLEIGGPRQMQVMPVANGWKKVLASFRDDYLKDLERTPARSIVLLIDFDEQEDRFAEAQTFIPNDLSQRVFILGALNEPEDLKRAKLGRLETVGAALARDCREGSTTIWEHEMLRHNADELERLRLLIRPILFQ